MNPHSTRTPGATLTSSDGRTKSTTRKVVLAIAALTAVSLLLTSVAAIANVSEKPAVANDAKCLKCHAKNLTKTLEDGNKLSLHVAESEFSDSVHGKIGCAGCHSEIAGKKHPSKESISDHRTFSLQQNKNCRSCHAGKFNQYEGSIHAHLVAEGDPKAPMCTDCHSAHAIQSMAVYEPVTGLPCKNCHEDIYDAYAQSVHGKARAEGNVIRASHIQAPICADCHSAHEVTAVASGDQLKATCLNCHDNARQAHAEWLPNSELHMSVVACPACHSPMAERGIDLELYDRLAQVPVGQNDGYDGMDERMHAAVESAQGLDALELWKLVRESSKQGQAVDVTLRGRMKVQTGVDAHRLAIKASAVRNCDSCHRKGSSAFQNVTVSIANPDGRKRYFQADTEVLSSIMSVDPISGFYAMGGTRIKLLDGLVILGLIGGLAVPIGHMTIGRLLRKKRQ